MAHGENYAATTFVYIEAENSPGGSDDKREV